MNGNFKNIRGITLIALVITIIVLLILAGVTIITLTGDNGLLLKAGDAKTKTTDAEVEEQIKLAYTEYQMEQMIGEPGDAITFMRNKLRTALNDNGLIVTGTFKVILSNGNEYFYNAELGEFVNSEVDLYPIATAGIATIEKSKYISNGKTAVIPAGYTVSDVTTEQSIDNGLVIYKDGSEWVWIPISSTDITEMYTEDQTGWTMIGTSGNNAVVTKYKTLSRIDISSYSNRTNPGIADNPYNREPDMVIGGGSQYDKVQSNYGAAGFSSFKDMATKLRDDFKNMIESVKKNGGFYIGRYELSSLGTKKNQQPLTNTNWYILYKKCKDLDSNGVETRMIWGCQWDQICKFISTSGDQVSLTDSIEYGNFSGSTSPANTGSNDLWKANNIYDIAGNCDEWTQEASESSGRARRGGSTMQAQIYRSVTFLNAERPDCSAGVFDRLTSRPVLYIK